MRTTSKKIIIPKKTANNLVISPSRENSSFEIILKPFSHLNLTFIPSASTKQISIKLLLDEGAISETFFAILGEKMSSIKIKNILNGKGSRVNERLIYSACGSQKINISTNTILNAEKTNAIIESKGILTEKASTNFEGRINVKSSAKKSSAKLTMDVLILSKDAHARAIPSLKIETSDVEASHSATISRIDESELFYCLSRGISQKTAIRLIAEGFLAKLYNDLETKDNLRKLIQKKLCHL